MAHFHLEKNFLHESTDTQILHLGSLKDKDKFIRDSLKSHVTVNFRSCNNVHVFVSLGSILADFEGPHSQKSFAKIFSPENSP